MKLKKMLALLLALTLSLTMLQGVAFGATNGEFQQTESADGTLIGATMTFRVLDDTAKTVQVGGNIPISGYTRAIHPSTTGAITIPATVTDAATGTTYTVTSIGNYSFYECTAITSVAFEADSKIENIKEYAFFGCEGIEQIALPDGVTSIGVHAFDKCTKLTSVTLPANLETIDGYAFYRCEAIKQITLPDGLISIANKAFERSDLHSIHIPASVTSIGSDAFSGCQNLSSATFEEGSQLKTIDNNAFLRTKLTSITIPASVEQINSFVFSASTLTSITFNGTPNINNNILGMSGGAPAPVATIYLAGEYNETTVNGLIAALASAVQTPTIYYNKNWSQADIDAFYNLAAIISYAGIIQSSDPNPTPTPDGGNGSAVSGSRRSTGGGAGAWYMGTGVSYTQIVDEIATTAMLKDGSVVNVVGQSPTGIIVKFNPTALSGHSTVTINNSIQDVSITATQIANLVAKADGGVIHITVKETTDGVSISATAGGVQVTL